MIRRIPIPVAMITMAVFTFLVLGLPLIGVYLSGRLVKLFVSFPPLTVPVVHRSFSWLVFLLYFIPSAGVMALIAAAARSKPEGPALGSSEFKRPLPWWGWVALGVLTAFWILAWSRFPWFAAYQRLTFIPLWVSYIVLMNAFCVRQSGT